MFADNIIADFFILKIMHSYFRKELFVCQAAQKHPSPFCGFLLWLLMLFLFFCCSSFRPLIWFAKLSHCSMRRCVNYVMRCWLSNWTKGKTSHTDRLTMWNNANECSLCDARDSLIAPELHQIACSFAGFSVALCPVQIAKCGFRLRKIEKYDLNGKFNTRMH